ncbi:MAG: serine hydrolase [Acidobacteriota bacterium]|nr:serine hydrolase [Acidobacteriota bacterium]
MNPKTAQSASELEKIIPRLMKDGEVPGLSVAIIRNAEVVWQRGFGVKNAGTKEPVDDGTVFEAASLSKPVFAYAVLKMVEDGKLDLDAPLNKYLPSAYIENDARLNAITARRVLSHTTGFPNWRADGKPLQIYFTPGERFSYSGEGFVYLQKVVEHLSGMPLQDFMRKTVFEPLKMTSSSYVWQPEYETLKAYAHDSAGNAAGRGKPAAANAASSLHTTALDYAKFLEAIFKRKGIKEATVKEMLRPAIKASESCAVCFESAAFSGKLSPSISWGLGWGLEHTPQGDYFWHWGDNGNVKAYVVADDKTQSGVVIFSNSANGLSIAREIVSRAFGASHTALDWLRYEPYDSPARTLLRDVLAGGEKAVDERFKDGKFTGAKPLDEAQINWVGYQLLGRKRYPEAIGIFRINARNFPASPNVYDSLGEAYLQAGNMDAASINYQKAVELNPQNTRAADLLKRLRSLVKADSGLLDAYAGDYQAPFGVLTIVRENERLIARVAGEPDTVLYPQSQNSFVELIRGTQLTFVKDAAGVITHTVILLNGRELEAKRIK